MESRFEGRERRRCGMCGGEVVFVSGKRYDAEYPNAIHDNNACLSVLAARGDISFTPRVERTERVNGNHETLPTLISMVSARTGADGEDIGLTHVFMVGPAGGGKTTAAKQTAESLGIPYYERSMGPATTEYDLVGFSAAATGEWNDGILREPWENGGLLMLDEMDNTNPQVLTALNAYLAHKPGETGRFGDDVIPRHTDFVCLAGGNTFGRGGSRIYTGTNELNGASLDRFSNLVWDYDETAEYRWTGEDMTAWVSYVQRVRRIVFDNGIRHIVSPRASINGAKLLRAGIEREQVEESVLWRDMSTNDRAQVKAYL